MSGAFQFSLTWDFVVRFLSITLIDLALSGDNAIVIGMAAASLPKKQRKFAIVFGGGLAIGLRIFLTAIATSLLTIPFLSAAGGLVLFWVAWKLLKLDTSEKSGAEQDQAKQAKNFRQAVVLIVTADFMMSLDNVIAVAGSAHGSVILILLGLILSMPLLMATGGAISLLIDKFKWLVYVGAAVISFTGARMIFEDRWVEPAVTVPLIVVVSISSAIGIVLPLIFVRINRRKVASLEEKAVDQG